MGLNNVSLREQNIVLIGFMGAGKTTIGKAVARKLYRDFIDIDEEIEKQFNMPTPKYSRYLGKKHSVKKKKKSFRIFVKIKDSKLFHLVVAHFYKKK